MINRNYENIPKELIKLKQWVCYKVENKDGHFEKKLVNPYNGKWAKSNEPNDWAYFSIAKKQMEKYNYDGLALCLTDIKGKDIRNDIFCIDLDKVLEMEQTTKFGDIEAQKLYEMFKYKTYIEFSISGKGLHIFGIGNLQDAGNRKNAIEIYDKKRFISLTGAKTEHSTMNLGNVQMELKKAHKLYIGEQVKRQAVIIRGELEESDNELIEKIRNSRQGAKFSQLFDNGSLAGDKSADDFALCRILAFWTRNDSSAMDRIFRQSALMRDKWDKQHGSETYGQMTIRNAISKSTVLRNSNIRTTSITYSR